MLLVWPICCAGCAMNKAAPITNEYTLPKAEATVGRGDMPILMSGIRAVCMMLAERLHKGDGDDGVDCDAAFLLHDLVQQAQVVMAGMEDRLQHLELIHDPMRKRGSQ